jgi:hypothetical protein
MGADCALADVWSSFTAGVVGASPETPAPASAGAPRQSTVSTLPRTTSEAAVERLQPGATGRRASGSVARRCPGSSIVNAAAGVD